VYYRLLVHAFFANRRERRYGGAENVTTISLPVGRCIMFEKQREVLPFLSMCNLER